MDQPDNIVSRRRFLQSALAGLGLTGLSTFLPARVMAATVGGSAATWASISDPAIAAQAWAARFTNTLPNPLDPSLLGIGFVYRPDPGTTSAYTVTAGQIDWNMLGPAGSGLPKTPVWGYGNYEGVAAGLPITFPGRSFVVQRGAPIQVNWVNNLAAPVLRNGQVVTDFTGNVVTDETQPLPHLVGIDPTITMATDQTLVDIDPASGNVSYGGNEIFGVPIAVHHHGGDSAKEFDGGPDQWTTPRRYQSGPGVNTGNSIAEHLRYLYDNNQEASLHWYHDHGEGVTRINAYAGLAGLYVVRDANEAQLLARKLIPGGAYEVPIVLQDKCFSADGRLAYGADPADYPVPGLNLPSPTHMPEMFGDVSVINGVAWPNLDVEPREYRLRLLNGSDSRFYRVQFGFGGMNATGKFNDYLEIYKIATDLGFLNAPVQMAGKAVLIAPGERMDVVVDFGKAKAANRGTPNTVVMTNDAACPYPFGAPTTPGVQGPGTLMRFAVRLPLNAAIAKTQVTSGKVASLRGLDPGTPKLASRVTVPANARVRRVLLAEGADEFGRIMPQLGTFQKAGDPPYRNYPGQTNLGTLAFSQLPTETPVAGTTEVWEFWNTTVDAHPIHMHLVQFRLINREAYAPSATAPIDPATGTQTVIEAKDMINGWVGSRLIESYVQLSGLPRNAPADEQGWKDTVICYPGEVTRVLVSFNRPGKYVYHCHILSHEEHDMMRWMEVLPAGTVGA
jgi:spore coat protein A